MSYAYRLSTLKLHSDIELPELIPWDGPHNAPADLIFRLGGVPPRLDSPKGAAGEFQTNGCRHYLTCFPGEARVLIENGSTVTIEPASGINLTEVRSILMAPVQAVLWHQRGFLPLHASVVAVNGRAVALAGPSGAGKSTLAAVLAAEGHPVLADDICIIDAADGVQVLPSSNRLRLWRDALDHLGIAKEALPRALSRREKYVVESGESPGRSPVPLAAVVLLSRSQSAAASIERLRGARSMIELRSVVHMLPEASALGLDATIFRALASLSSSGVAIWELTTPDDWKHLLEAAKRILSAATAS